MNWRKTVYLGAHRLTHSGLAEAYAHLLTEDQTRSHTRIAHSRLQRLLLHCAANVPYYHDAFRAAGLPTDPTALAALLHEQDPATLLAHLPILTKPLIRRHQRALVSDDLAQRRWYYNTSGGSTGEPIRLIQDHAHKAQIVATQMLYSTWAGCEVGEAQLSLWGSEREILRKHVGWGVLFANALTQRTLLNAFRLTPARMRAALAHLNTQRPKLIVAYAQALYELARFAEREGLTVVPQQAIISSAGTLYPFMRQTLERVFGCPVFDRYGSREIGDIAGECSEHSGWHVLPWTAYVEVVDATGRPVPAGEEGRLLVTCLSNQAMPLLRYDIGDRGALAPADTTPPCACGREGQRLLRVSGRNTDGFTSADGAFVDGEYFTHLLYFRPWVRKFQVIQESLNSVRFKIEPTSQPCPSDEMDDITAKTRVVMGPECAVEFEFVEQIPLLASGKYRYTISHVTR